MWFRFLLWTWTVVGWIWVAFDTVTKPTNWYNFTSWTWFLQTIFYSLFLAVQNSEKNDTVSSWVNNRLKMDTADHFIFLDAYMLPIVWSCEWTAAIAVVYMMVDDSGVLQDALNKNGPTLTWIGNFLIHYMTVVVLFVYMQQDTKRIFTCTKNARENAPGRTSLLYIVLFTLTYAYATFFPPASHYGIAGMTDTVAALLLLGVSASGLAVFQNWTKG